MALIQETDRFLQGSSWPLGVAFKRLICLFVISDVLCTPRYPLRRKPSNQTSKSIVDDLERACMQAMIGNMSKQKAVGH